MDFHVDLNIFRGPLDLLLYLVRKHEVEIVDIPISLITEQYLEYLTVLEQLDVGAVGDFLAMASLLIEIKSQQVLPRADEVEEELEDPRQELVRRLLEYKQYRDAASILDERGRDWQQHYPRVAGDLPPRQRNLAEEPIHEVELWDLVSAFGRIIRENVATKPSNIVYDDTPIHVHMSRILARLNGARPAGAQRTPRRPFAQVGPDRHVLGRPGTGATPPRSGRAKRPVRRNLDPARPGRQRAFGPHGSRQLRAHPGWSITCP